MSRGLPHCDTTQAVCTASDFNVILIPKLKKLIDLVALQSTIPSDMRYKLDELCVPLVVLSNTTLIEQSIINLAVP